jgi:hypothetical protein
MADRRLLVALLLIVAGPVGATPSFQILATNQTPFGVVISDDGLKSAA